MPKSYQAVYEQGHLHWLDEPPPLQKSRVLVTVLDDPQDMSKATMIRERLRQSRGAWGKATDTQALDAEINAWRDEWQRPWESVAPRADE